MRILGLVDIHSRTDKLEDVLWEAEDCDLVLLGGDITNFGKSQAAADVLTSLLERVPLVLGVTGNCDYPEVNKFLSAHHCSLENGPREVHDFYIVGVGGSLPCPTKTPNERSEQSLQEALSHHMEGYNEEKHLIAVVHQPPFATELDRSLLAGHVGSHAVRSFIEKYQPTLFFSGHIHESQAIQKIENTTLVNPGPFLKGNYFVAEMMENEVFIELRKI